MSSQAHDCEIRAKFFESAGGDDAAHAWHGEVHDDDVELCLANSFDRLRAVAGLAHDFRSGSRSMRSFSPCRTVSWSSTNNMRKLVSTRPPIRASVLRNARGVNL